MKITKHILAACILTGMVACDTDKEIAVFNEDSGAIKINAVIDAAYTRSNPTGTNEQQMQFNNGDQILLSCEDGSVFTFLKCRSVERIMKYSLSAVVSRISQPRTLQPNSADIISQSRIFTSAHSRRAFMPCIFVSFISTPSLYQSAARHLSASSEPLILRL